MRDVPLDVLFLVLFQKLLTLHWDVDSLSVMIIFSYGTVIVITWEDELMTGVKVQHNDLDHLRYMPVKQYVDIIELECTLPCKQSLFRFFQEDRRRLQLQGIATPDLADIHLCSWAKIDTW